ARGRGRRRRNSPAADPRRCTAWTRACRAVELAAAAHRVRVAVVLAAPRGAAAGVAFEARAVANEREVAAFAAGLAFVALGLGFGALLRRQRARARTRLGNLAAGDGELVLL